MGRPHPLLFELAAERVPTASYPLAVQDLLHSAFEHRMQGLLWSSLAAGQIELPPEQKLLLAARDLIVQAHHDRLWSRLFDVQARLARLGVQTAAAKGVTAEDRWYLRVGERPCSDIDLLLEPGSETRLADVMDELQPGHPLRSEIVGLVRTGALQSVDLVVDGVAIDLHVDLLKVEIPTRGAEALWSRTHVIQSSSGVSVRVIDAETSLIHFAIHLNKDRFARLLAFADVARVLARESLDWSFIESFVAGEGLRVPVFNSLHAVTSALRLSPPPVPRLRHGWRGKAWNRLWPARQRLLGYTGIGTRLHRHLWIPWLAEGRMWESLVWWTRRRALPNGDLLRLYDPDVTGPYPVKLIVGRFRGWRTRRRAARAARHATLETASSSGDRR